MMETFKLNTFFDSGNFNTYDSYGQALAESGNREDAIRMYKRSLELNPKNEGGIQALKKLPGHSEVPNNYKNYNFLLFQNSFSYRIRRIL